MISKEQIEALAMHIAQLIEGIGFDDLQTILHRAMLLQREYAEQRLAWAAERAAAEGRRTEAEAEYVAYATAWIDAVDDANAGEARWLREKSMRNQVNVGWECRETLQEILRARVMELRGTAAADGISSFPNFRKFGGA
jgi:hypothetical protein